MPEKERDIKQKSNKKTNCSSNLEDTQLISDDIMPCPQPISIFLVKKPPIVFVYTQTENCGYTKLNMVDGTTRYKSDTEYVKSVVCEGLE